MAISRKGSVHPNSSQVGSAIDHFACDSQDPKTGVLGSTGCASSTRISERVRVFDEIAANRRLPVVATPPLKRVAIVAPSGSHALADVQRSLNLRGPSPLTGKLLARPRSEHDLAVNCGFPKSS